MIGGIGFLLAVVSAWFIYLDVKAGENNMWRAHVAIVLGITAVILIHI